MKFPAPMNPYLRLVRKKAKKDAKDAEKAIKGLIAIRKKHYGPVPQKIKKAVGRLMGKDSQDTSRKQMRKVRKK